MNREFLLTCAGLLALTVHAVDETMIFGAPSGPPWGGQAAIILVLGTLTALHPRLGAWRSVPTVSCLALGAFAVVTGWTAHVWPLFERGPAPGDPSGVVFLLGGILLLVSGGLLLRHLVAAGPRASVARPGLTR